DDLPHLVLRNAPTPRRHSRRAPFGDRAQQLGIAAAVNPDAVAEARPHAAARAPTVASRTVVLHEELPSLGRRRRVARIRIVHVAEKDGRVNARFHAVRRRRRDAVGDGARRCRADVPAATARFGRLLIAADDGEHRSDNGDRREHVRRNLHGRVPPDAVCGAVSPAGWSVSARAWAPSSVTNGTWYSARMCRMAARRVSSSCCSVRSSVVSPLRTPIAIAYENGIPWPAIASPTGDTSSGTRERAA